MCRGKRGVLSQDSIMYAEGTLHRVREFKAALRSQLVRIPALVERGPSTYPRSPEQFKLTHQVLYSGAYTDGGPIASLVVEADWAQWAAKVSLFDFAGIHVL